MRLLRSHGMSSLTWDRHKGHASSYDVMTNGYNYRLDELHAALGRAQLAKLQHNNKRRRRLLKRIATSLQSLAGWMMPFADSIDFSSGHLMVVVAPTPEIRTKAVNTLRDARIQSSMHYPCIADFSAFQNVRNDEVRTNTTVYGTRDHASAISNHEPGSSDATCRVSSFRDC